MKQTAANGDADPPTTRTLIEAPPPVPGYELLRCIGHGSYGDVWLGLSTLGSFHAIKIVYRHRFEDDKPYEREFDGIRRFEPVSRTHAGLVHVLHAERNDADGHFHYVMELADPAKNRAHATPKELIGEGILPPLDPSTYVPRTLRSEVRHFGRISIAESLRLGLILSDALDHLHKKELIHRDIKPSNIIFVGGNPKLADIGLVTHLDSARSYVGTEGYIPPEGPGTKQADVFSLGKVLYEIATGKEPRQFPEPPTARRAPDGQEQWQELNEVILKACAADPSKRYNSAAEMNEDIVLIRRGKSIKRLRLAERRLKLAVYSGIAMAVIAATGLWIQQSRTEAARAKIKLAEEREQEQRRQVLMQEVQQTRWITPEHGWSDRAWQSVVAASAIRKDDALRNQAFACLSGLDAKLIGGFTDFSASSVAFDREGRRLLAGGISEGAKLWSFDSGKVSISQITRPGPVAFRADGIPVQFAGQEHGSYLLWNVAEQRPLQEFRLSGLDEPGKWPFFVQEPMAITPDASLVAAAECFQNGDGKYGVWDTASGRLLFEGLSKVFSLAFSQDGSLFAAGDNDGNITLWSVPEGRIVTVLKDDRLSIRSLAFSRKIRAPGADSQGKLSWFLAAGDEGGTITVWDLAGQAVRVRLQGSSYHVYTVAFSPDGTLLASAGRFEARLWDLMSGQLLLTIRDGDLHTGIVFSQDGKMLALCSQTAFPNQPGLVRVYQLENGRGIMSLRGIRGSFGVLSISPDRRWVAGLSHNWTVGIWERETGQFKHAFQVAKAEIAEYAWLAFTGDGKRIAFAVGDGGCVWDVSSGQECHFWGYKNSQTWVPKEESMIFARAAPNQRQLPGRLYWFDRSGHLFKLFFDNEIKPGDTAETTRFTWAVRDVMKDDTPKILGVFERRHFKWDAIAIGNDGLQFIVLGSEIQNGRNTALLTVFDMNTGKKLWTHSQEIDSSTFPLLDTTHSLVAYDSYGSKTKLADITTGRLERMINGKPIVLGRLGDYWVGRNLSGHDYRLYRLDSESSVALFDTRKFCGAFSPDGSLLAWGNLDGTISVCDLEAVRDRLGTLGISW